MAFAASSIVRLIPSMTEEATGQPVQRWCMTPVKHAKRRLVALPQELRDQLTVGRWLRHATDAIKAGER